MRTLHHYDEIGLLPPSGRAANGYRTYTAVDVARLQRVLSWRELGFDLEQVAALLPPTARGGRPRPAAGPAQPAAGPDRAVAGRGRDRGEDLGGTRDGHQPDPRRDARGVRRARPDRARRGGEAALGRHRRLPRGAPAHLVVRQGGVAADPARGRRDPGGSPAAMAGRAPGRLARGCRRCRRPPRAHQPLVLRGDTRGAPRRWRRCTSPTRGSRDVRRRGTGSRAVRQRRDPGAVPLSGSAGSSSSTQGSASTVGLPIREPSTACSSGLWVRTSAT